MLGVHCAYLNSNTEIEYMNFNICSDGGGDSAFEVLDCLIQRAFPYIHITHDQGEEPDLVVRSHFEGQLSYDCPYICFSGESYLVPYKEDYDPILEINTIHTNRPNSAYLPYIVFEHKSIVRPFKLVKKKYCSAFVYSNEVPMRETFFHALREAEPASYSFGKRIRTHDNPFELPKDRSNNNTLFQEFGFYIAMENSSVPGYITEKIGFAYNSGTVPIYWGDNDTVNRFFNPESFLNVANYRNLDDAVSSVVHIWNDPHKYKRILNQPITLNNDLLDYQMVYTSYRPWQKPIFDALYDAYPDIVLGSSFWNSSF